MTGKFEGRAPRIRLQPATVEVALGLSLLLLPVIARYDDYVLHVFTQALLLAALALAWNLLGLSGSISLGHAAFFGVGAYGSALLSLNCGLSGWLSLPLAGLLAAGLALIMAGFCLRLRGAYFALATLAFVEIPRVVTDNWQELTRGSLGLGGLPGLPSLRLGSWHLDIGASPVASYYLLLLYALVLLGLLTVVFRSNLGLALRAIHQEEVAAAALGVQVSAFRLLSLVLSSFFSGICGGLYAHLVGYIEPALVYGLYFSAIPMIFAICGGRFTIIGPGLAALVLYPLDQFIFHPLLPAGHQFLYGLAIVLAILFVPGGFWGWLQRGEIVSFETGGTD